MTSRTTKHKGRKAVATAALMAFAGAALVGANPAFADNGGSGGTAWLPGDKHRRG